MIDAFLFTLILNSFHLRIFLLSPFSHYLQNSLQYSFCWFNLLIQFSMLSQGIPVTWCELNFSVLIFFGFSPAFNFAGHPPFCMTFLAGMVSSFGSNMDGEDPTRRVILYGWNLCFVRKVGTISQARKRNHLHSPILKEVSVRREERRDVVLGPHSDLGLQFLPWFYWAALCAT